MEITKALVLVELDNSGELRQLLIKKGDDTDLLITLIASGTFHEGDITISDHVLDSIIIGRVEDDQS